MKVKTEEKTGILILNDAAWQTDGLSFSTESLPGIEDSSDLDIVGAHQQLKNPCEQVLNCWGLLLKTAYNSFRMCVAYSTMNEVAHTKFSYFYQNAANDARLTFNICTAGNHAN